MTSYYAIIPGKTNIKADVVSRKDQVDTKKDNKDVQTLKDKIWTRRNTIVEVMIIQRNQVVEEIWRKNTKELEKDEEQA